MQNTLRFVLFVTTSIAFLAAPTTLGGQASPTGRPASTCDRATLPVADYAQLVATLGSESAIRIRTNDLFNGANCVTSDPAAGGSQYINLELGAGLSSIPVDASDLIVRCRVVDAHAFLAGDRGNVYSSYSLHVDETIKADRADIRSIGELEGIRHGGALRYPNGVGVSYFVNGCGPLAVGTDYVLFLRYLANGTYPMIQMAYAVTECGICAVDGNLGNDVSARSFNGTRVADFVAAIRARISTPLKTVPLDLPKEPCLETQANKRLNRSARRGG